MTESGLPVDLNGVSYDDLLTGLGQDLQLGSPNIQNQAVGLPQLGTDVNTQLATYQTAAQVNAALAKYLGAAAGSAVISWGVCYTGSSAVGAAGSGDWTSAASGLDTYVSFVPAKAATTPTALVSATGIGTAPPYIAICGVSSSSQILVGAIDSTGTHQSGVGIGFIFIG